jgi:mycofactocin precursor peptide peptidase
VTSLAGTVWPAVPAAPLIVVPLGSTEQHGHHLPPGSDTTVACAVAEGAVDELDGALLAPALAYGASGEHEDFPGTVAIGTEALTVLLVEYGRSACRWAGRVLLVNGDGGNLDALVTATGVLRREGRDVAWFPCGVPGDAHAGRSETSLVLHVERLGVLEERAGAGSAFSLDRLLPRLRTEGAEDGGARIGDLVERLVATAVTWQVDPTGRLIE